MYGKNDIYFKKNVFYKINAEDISGLIPQLPLVEKYLHHEHFRRITTKFERRGNLISSYKITTMNLDLDQN